MARQQSLNTLILQVSRLSDSINAKRKVYQLWTVIFPFRYSINNLMKSTFYVFYLIVIRGLKMFEKAL